MTFPSSAEMKLYQTLHDLPTWSLNWAERAADETPVTHRVPADLVQRLQAVTKNNPWAAYSVLTAALRVTLFRLGAAPDLVIASPAPEAEARGGPLLVRVALAPEWDLRRLSSAQREALQRARAGLAVDRQGFETAWRNNGSGPCDDLLRVVWRQDGLTRDDQNDGHYQFHWRHTSEETRLTVACSAPTGGSALAQQLAATMLTILTQWLAEPTQQAAHLSLLDDASPAIIHANQSGAFPDTTVLQLFKDKLGKQSSKIAINFNQTNWTYADFEARVQARARFLQDHGIGRGDRVAVWGERSAQLVVSLWAIQTAGAAWLALDPALPPQRLAFMLVDSGAKAVLGLPEQTPLSLPTGCRALATQSEGHGCAMPVSVSVNDEAYVIYTSGSTGKPKGVPIHHGALAQYIQWAASVYRNGTAMPTALFTTPAFDLTITALYLPLTQGDPLIVFGEESPEALLPRVFADPRVRLAKLTPAHVALLEPLAKSQVGAVILGGEALLPEQVRRLRRLNPAIRIFNEYGPTEATVGCTVQEVVDADDITIGRPARHAQLAIVDERGHAMPAGFIGELWIGGGALTAGYLNRPDLNQTRFHTGPGNTRFYASGDLVSLRHDGNLVYHGRNDFQLKINGYRIESGEIERCLSDRDDIDAAVVIATQGPNNTKVLCAYVVGTGAANEATLRETVAAALPLYMMPAFFVPLQNLPLTPNGKVDRRALPAPRHHGAVDEAPRDPREQLLCDAFTAVFPGRHVDRGADFFALGGDSIKALQITAQVNQAGYALEVGDLFREPQLAQLASALTPRTPTRAFAPLSGTQPTTPAQQHFLRWFEGTRAAYNQSVLLDLPQRREEPELNALITSLLTRHEGLRARFPDDQTDSQAFDGAMTRVRWVDLRGVDAVRTRLQQEAATDQRDFDLSAGPLFRATLFRCDDRDRLLLAAHHLVVDGVSWRLLLADLRQLLAQNDAGLPYRSSPRGAGVDLYHAWLQKRFTAPILQERRAFWSAQTADTQTPSADQHGLSASGERLGFISIDWDATATTRLLGPVHRVFHTDINDLLLTALADALWRCERLERVQVLLESHGRDLGEGAPDFSQTVGWFTTWFPIVLQGSEDAVRTRLTAVKEQRHAVRHAGIDYTLLTAGGDWDGPTPAIAFNYLGSFEQADNDSGPRFSDWDIGPAHDPLDPPAFPWFFSGMVVEGKLQLNLAYDTHGFSRTRMQTLVTGFQQAVNELADALVAQPRSWLSPADLNGIELAPATLERLQADHELESLYPLSPMQHGMLFHHSLAEDGAYVEQISQVLDGRVEADLLAQALTRVLHDAEIGRTLFFADLADRPLQALLTTCPIQLEVHQLGDTFAGGTADQICRDLRAAGFDLSAEPPLRVTLLGEGDQRARLVWTFHHILMDGWCLPLVFGRLIEQYRALQRGQALQAQPTPPFRRFITWLERQPQDAAAAWWRRTLDGHVPTPLARPTTAGGRRDSLSLRWSALDSAALRRFAAEHRVTANHVVQVLWALLVAREGFHEEATFGAVVSGRPAEVAGVDDMVGLFINTVPVRVRFDGAEPLTQVLARRREQAVAMEHHQYLPLAQIQQGRQLFDHILVFENYPEGTATLDETDDFTVAEVLAHEQTHYALTLVVVPDENFLFRADFDSAHFDRARIERLLTDLPTLLKAWIAEQTLCPNQLPAKPIPQPQAPAVRDVLTALQATTAKVPDAVAVRTPDSSLSYQALCDQITTLAEDIGSRITPGDRVAVALPHGIELLPSLLAVLYCGGAYVPLDPTMPVARARAVLADAAPVLILTETATAQAWQLSTDQWRQPRLAVTPTSAPWSPRSVSGDGPAYLIFTSGSTGQPKGVVISRANLAWYTTQAAATYFDQDPAADMALFTNIAFDLTVTTLFTPLLRGAAVVVPAGDALDEQLQAAFAPESGVHAVKMTPAHVGLLENIEATGVHIAVLGGEALQDEVVTRLRSLNPSMRIFNEYGPTETTVGCSVAEIGDAPISIGRPMAGVCFAVHDRWGRPLPAGAVGELIIGGSGVASGYYRRDRETDAKFFEQDGTRFYRSGDLVRCDHEGRYHFLGRIDNQLSLRGLRIEPGEIETRLATLAGVSEVVVDLWHGDQGPKLTAWLRGSAVPAPDALRAALSEDLPGFMVPERWVVVATFPLTRNGKIDRAALPAPARVAQGRQAQTSEERLLARVWGDVLGLNEVAVDADFFALGGDSIKALTIRARLRAAGYDLTLKDLFREGSIARLAPSLRDSAGVEHRVDTGRIALAPIQAWFLDLSRRRPQHYNQSLLWRLPADLNADQVVQAWSAVLAHHRLPSAHLRDGALWVDETGTACRVTTISAAAGSASQIADRRQTQFELGQGPLMQLVRIDEPDAQYLFLCAHHLVIDGVSWRVLFDDYRTAYAAVSAGTEVQLPPVAAAFGDWTRALHAAMPDIAARENRHWQNLPTPTPPPVNDRVPSRVGDVVRTDRQLDGDLTRFLLGPIHKHLNSTINDVLVYGLVTALRQVFDITVPGITLEGHGRDHDQLDLSRTVGWFTAMYPVVFTDGGEADVMQRFAQVQAALQAVPNQGQGYGALRWLANAELAPLPTVLFNYLGRFESVAAMGEFLDAGREQDDDEAALFDYSFGAGVQENAQGAHLSLFLDHVPGRVDSKHATALIAAFTEALRALADAAQQKPALSPFAARAGDLQARLQAWDLYPATPMQAGLLFQARLALENDADATTYVSQLRLDLNRPLDHEAFRSAVTELHRNRPILRTTFVNDDKQQLWQVVGEPTEVPVRQADFRELAAGTQAFEQFAEAERRRVADPSARQLCRWADLRVGASGGVLLWTFHHALLDGWSVGLLLNELIQRYSAALNRQKADLAAAPSYRDYVVWLERRDHAAARRWWRAHLAAAHQATVLPLPITPDPTMGHQAWHMDDAGTLLDALSRLARARRTTLNHLCCAFWCALLARLGNQTQVVFGAVDNGRPSDLAEADTMAGLFLTTLPVSVTVGAELRICDLATHLQDLAANRADYRFLPPGEVQALSPLGPALINNLVVFENYPVPDTTAADAGGLQIDALEVAEWNHYDLSLVIVPGDAASLRIEYNGSRFAATDVARLGNVLRDWLAHAATTFDQTATELTVHPQAVFSPVLPETTTSHGENEASGIQTDMRDLWCTVLDRTFIPDHANFFALGGHSLSAAKLTAAISDHFGVAVPLRTLFTYPTIGGLCAWLAQEQQRRVVAETIQPAPPAAHYPLSPAQKRIWILAKLDESGIAYNMPTAVLIDGPFDYAALRTALQDTVQRHEILRTRFPEHQGEPVQMIEASAIVPFEQKRCTEADVEQQLRDHAETAFDLAAGPLLGALVLEHSPTRRTFALNLHHLLADAWSMELLIREVLRRYHAAVAGTRLDLPTPKLQFKDVALWLKQRAESDLLAEQRTFWRDQLTDAPAPISLPSDHARPLLASHRGDRLSLAPQAELGRRLLTFAHEHELTPFALLLTALNLLIQRHTGRTDIVVGAPVANRDHADLAQQLGVFINTLALRNQVPAALPFIDAAGQVQRRLTRALANQAYPFDQLVYDLQSDTTRDQAGHGALFDIMISMVQQSASSDEPASNLTVTPVESPFRTSKLDLSFDFLLDGDVLHASIEFNSDLYERATVACFGRRLTALLEALLAAPHLPCAHSDGLDAEERRHLLHDLHPLARRRVDQPAVTHWFHQHRTATPDAPALLQDGYTTTYAALDQRAAAIAAGLKREGRVRRGDVVAVCLPRGFDLPAAMLAVWRLGAIYLPLDHSMPADRLRRILAEAKTRALLAEPDIGDVLRDHRYRVVSPSQHPAETAPAPVKLDADTPAYLIFTSGSTGKPKGVLVAHGALAHTIGHAVQHFDFNASDRMAFIAPQAFDISLFELLVPLCSGGAVDLLTREQVLDLDQLAAAFERVTAFHAVPHLMERLLQHLTEQGFATAPRIVFTGGDRVPTALLQRLCATLATTRVVELYGPTEAAVICSALEVNAYVADLATRNEAARYDNCIGRALPGVVIHLRDAHGGLVPPGAEGEITVSGPGLALGYWRNRDADQTRFQERDGQRFYRTGDRARRLPDGRLVFLGRGDSQIQVRGFRVEPGEIEAALMLQAPVRGAVVMNHGDASQRCLTAWCETDGHVAEADLRRDLRARLPEYMVPERWFLLAQFPLNRNGKVDRAALQAMQVREPRNAVTARRHPGTGAERALAEIWRDVLGHDRFGIDDHFADVGGHSLEVTRVAALINQRLGRKIGIRALFQHPSIAALAAAELADWEAPSPTIIVQPVADAADYPTTSAQERMWLLSRFPQAAQAYHIPAAVHIEGVLDVAAFAAALNDLVQRHEILRTVFVHGTQGPRQRVVPAEQAPRLAVKQLEHFEQTDLQQLARQHATDGFDLADAPPWRATLYRQDANHGFLLICLHHILADGWSMGVFVREWQQCYLARRAGRAPQLPPLPFQYRDYAVQQRKALADGAFADAEQYWRRQFACPPSALDLPADFPRPEVQTYRGAQISWQCPARLRAAALNLAKQCHGGLFSVLVAAVKTLFFRYSSQTDITIGLPSARRTLPGSEDQLGLYLNTLALRTRLAPRANFAALVTQVAHAMQEAQEHGDLPFDRLVELLKLPRNPARNALFDCMLSFEAERRNAFIEDGDLQLRGFDFDKTTTHFDLTLSFHDLDDGLVLLLEYNRDLYTATRMERFLDHFETLLDDVLTTPQQLLCRARLLPNDEAQRLLAPVSAAPDITSETVAARFQQIAEQLPDRVALESGDETWTYAELARIVYQLANHLRDACGVARGDRVAFLVAREPAMIVAPLAISHIGAVYVPIDPVLPEQRMRFILQDAKVRLLLAGGSTACRAESLGVPTLVLPTGEQPGLPTTPPPHQHGGQDPLYLVYTSGSTGTPKGVLVHNAALLNAVSAWREIYQLGPGSSRSLQMAGVGFDVFSGDLGRALLNGGTLVLCPEQVRLDPMALCDLLQKQRVHLFETTPAVLAPLLDYLIENDLHLPHLRLLIGGSDTWPAALYSRWRAWLEPRGVRLVNSYGVTEATVDSCAFEGELEHDHGHTPIGRPLAGMALYVRDAFGNLVPEGVPGELAIGGAGVALGYWARPGLTAERFVPNPYGPGRLYCSGDRAVRQRDGNFVFLGRDDGQVKVRGVRIELGEIEAVLREDEQVATCAVVADSHHIGAVLVPIAGVTFDQQALATKRADLQRLLPGTMVPRLWAAASALPLTANAKVDRPALWALLRETHTTASAVPQTAREQELAILWAELLDLDPDQLGVEDDFFERGGHSLRVAQLDRLVRRRFGVTLAFDAWFRATTIRTQAQLIDAAGAAESAEGTP